MQDVGKGGEYGDTGGTGGELDLPAGGNGGGAGKVADPLPAEGLQGGEGCVAHTHCANDLRGPHPANRARQYTQATCMVSLIPFVVNNLVGFCVLKLQF